MSPFFVEHIRQFKATLASAGLLTGQEKEVPYGRRIDVTDASATVPVTLYEGKKGFTMVVGGKACGLKTNLESLFSIAAAPVVDPEGKPYGFEDQEGFEAGWIGTDESGKGDVFGPLVVAAVSVNPQTVSALESAGVKDCKQLSDKKVAELAVKIRQLCAGRFQELVLFPARYNSLYKTMKAEGKNLNHLLAWAHARVIEDTLELAPCKFAITDKFADVRFVESKLMARGRAIVLVQKPYAERNIAVAAASVLARDSFLKGLDLLSKRYCMEFPKGAGTPVPAAVKRFVAEQGREALSEVGKVHFKTFEGVL